MKFKYDIAIFDLDGTLLDTSKGIKKSVEYTIDKYNLKKLDNEQLLTFIGPPIQESFMKWYKFNKDECQKVSETFRDRYKNIDLLQAKPYEGIFDVLKTLIDSEIKIAVATYKREDYAIMLLKYFGFDRYFKVISGADNFNKLRKKDIIELSISKCDSNNKEKVVYIGDTQSDFNSAKELGIDFIGVNYGFGFKEIDNYANCPNDILLYMR